MLSILLPLSPEAGSGQVEEAAPAPKSKAKNAAKKAAPAKKAVGKVPKAVSTGRQRPPQPSAAGNNRSETAPPAKKAVLGVGSQIEVRPLTRPFKNLSDLSISLSTSQ